MKAKIQKPLQLQLLDLLEPHKNQNDQSFKRRKLEKTLSKIRSLQEELNQALYAATESERPIIHSPTDAVEILAPFMEHLKQEELWVLLLSTRNHVLKVVHRHYVLHNASESPEGLLLGHDL